MECRDVECVSGRFPLGRASESLGEGACKLVELKRKTGKQKWGEDRGNRMKKIYICNYQYFGEWKTHSMSGMQEADPFGRATGFTVTETRCLFSMLYS